MQPKIKDIRISADLLTAEFIDSDIKQAQQDGYDVLEYTYEPLAGPFLKINLKDLKSTGNEIKAATVAVKESNRQQWKLYIKTFKKQGWKFEKLRCYKKIADKEIDIEFCIGDFCLGIYDKNLDLLEPKIRCKSFIEAVARSESLKSKYI